MTGVLRIKVNGVWQDAVEPGPPGVRGTRGPPGPAGLAGPRGAPGDTVPVGGLVNDYLVKTGDPDFEVGWQGLIRSGQILSKELRGPFNGTGGGSYWDVVLEPRDYVLMATAQAYATSVAGQYLQIQLDGAKAPTIPTHPGPYVRLWFNVTGTHQTMGTCTIDLIYGRDFLVPGTHRLSLVENSPTIDSNGEDWGHMVLFPQPLP